MAGDRMQGERERLTHLIEAEELWIFRTPWVPHHRALANIARWRAALDRLAADSTVSAVPNPPEARRSPPG